MRGNKSSGGIVQSGPCWWCFPHRGSCPKAWPCSWPNSETCLLGGTNCRQCLWTQNFSRLIKFMLKDIGHSACQKPTRILIAQIAAVFACRAAVIEQYFWVDNGDGTGVGSGERNWLHRCSRNFLEVIRITVRCDLFSWLLCWWEWVGWFH